MKPVSKDAKDTSDETDKRINEAGEDCNYKQTKNLVGGKKL